MIFYSCRDCHGGKRVSVAGIREHLWRVGRDPFLMRSILGGDPEAGYPEIGAWGESDISRRSTENQTEMADNFFDCNDHLPSPVLNEDHQIHDMFMDAIKTADDRYNYSRVHDIGVHVDDFKVDDVEEEYMRELEELYANVFHPYITPTPM
jgi:hypothetical protein